MAVREEASTLRGGEVSGREPEFSREPRQTASLRSGFRSTKPTLSDDRLTRREFQALVRLILLTLGRDLLIISDQDLAKEGVMRELVASLKVKGGWDPATRTVTIP